MADSIGADNERGDRHGDDVHVAALDVRLDASVAPAHPPHLAEAGVVAVSIAS